MLWILENIEALDPAVVLSLLPFVSEPRRRRVLKMTHRPTQVCSVLAELLLRHALEAEHGLREIPKIETGEKGKPFFPERPELHFNLSHCRTAVACALDRSPVGVDVQELRSVRRDKHRLSEPPLYRILSEPERAWVEAGETPGEQDRRFTAIWTCKEAWGKALGVGFLYELNNTCFLPNRESWEQNDFLFFHRSENEYELTLCSASHLPVQIITPKEL